MQDFATFVNERIIEASTPYEDGMELWQISEYVKDITPETDVFVRWGSRRVTNSTHFSGSISIDDITKKVVEIVQYRRAAYDPDNSVRSRPFVSFSLRERKWALNTLDKLQRLYESSDTKVQTASTVTKIMVRVREFFSRVHFSRPNGAWFPRCHFNEPLRQRLESLKNDCCRYSKNDFARDFPDTTPPMEQLFLLSREEILPLS